MKLFRTDQFAFPLPEGHRFPRCKYALLRERLLAQSLVRADELLTPHAATDEELLRAHDRAYIERVQRGMLSAEEVRRLGLPWSPELAERSRRSVGGTIEACRWALREGWSANLAGGTHHAFRDRGEGFCVFNDCVVAARAMQAEGKVQRVAIIDCDVHQGNGTAVLCQEDRSIYTFSIHGAKNYPLRKESSCLDVALAPGTADTTYLNALEPAVQATLEHARPELVLYLAGADPYLHDRFGTLGLTREGLLERDRLVLDLCQRAGVPVAVTLAGGYAPDVNKVVAIHCATIAELLSRE